MKTQSKNFDVKFEKYAYGGESMGRLADGRAVFAPFVLAGEEARIQPVLEKKGFIKGKKINLISTVHERTTARCKHFEECGGCHYQHLNYADQLRVKEQIVFDQLQRLGGITHPTVKSILGCDEPFYYRNSVQFHVGDGGEVGFLSAFGQDLIPIEECYLPQEEILALWKTLDFEVYPGLQKIHFRCGADGDLMVILESDLFDELPTMELDMPISVIHLSPAGSIVMGGDDHVVMQVKGKYFRVSAESFFQVNAKQAEKMVEVVSSYLPEEGNRLVELYSGVGLFTAFLAPRFQEVIAVESAESSCNDFAVNLDMYDHIGLYVGEAEEVLPNIEGNTEIVLVDPPRAGLHPKVIDAIAEKGTKTLVYVSCDPATLARDVKRLGAHGYELVEVTPIDMFPQTYHVEMIALITKHSSD